MRNPLQAVANLARALWAHSKAWFTHQLLTLQQRRMMQSDVVAAAPTPDKAPPVDCAGCHALLSYSYRITQSFEGPLRLVMRETEQSALGIMERVKNLDHTATQLVNYLTQADQDAQDMQAQIQNSSAIIERIGHFMQQLPEKIEAERQGSLGLVEKINEMVKLNVIAESIKDVSRLTNMVAINASIQAAHAGEYGRGFSVVADEVRHLSARSSEAADLITSAITDIHQAIHSYLDNQVHRDFAQDIQEAAHIMDSVHQLHDSHEDMNQYYKTLMTVVKEYNVNMANAIVDALSNMQYQDVVRQRLERVLAAQTRYCETLYIAINEPSLSSSSRFKESLEQVLNNYLEEESHHSGDQNTSDDNSEGAAPKIELF